MSNNIQHTLEEIVSFSRFDRVNGLREDLDGIELDGFSFLVDEWISLDSFDIADIVGDVETIYEVGALGEFLTNSLFFIKDDLGLRSDLLADQFLREIGEAGDRYTEAFNDIVNAGITRDDVGRVIAGMSAFASSWIVGAADVAASITGTKFVLAGAKIGLSVAATIYSTDPAQIEIPKAIKELPIQIYNLLTGAVERGLFEANATQQNRNELEAIVSGIQRLAEFLSEVLQDSASQDFLDQTKQLYADITFLNEQIVLQHKFSAYQSLTDSSALYTSNSGDIYREIIEKTETYVNNADQSDALPGDIFSFFSSALKIISNVSKVVGLFADVDRLATARLDTKATQSEDVFDTAAYLMFLEFADATKEIISSILSPAGLESPIVNAASNAIDVFVDSLKVQPIVDLDALRVDANAVEPLAREYISEIANIVKKYFRLDESGAYEGGVVTDGPPTGAGALLTNLVGAPLGDVTISAPTFTADGEIDYTVAVGGIGRATQYNIAYIIDVSFSMQGQRIEDAKAAYIELTDQLIDLGFDDNSNFAIIRFNIGAASEENLRAEQLGGPLQSIQPANLGFGFIGSNIGTAIQEALNFFAESVPGQVNIAYVISDGEQLVGATDALTAVADVQAFGVGSGADLDALSIIDSDDAIQLLSSAQLVDVLTGSNVDAAVIDRVEVFLNGALVETITRDQLVDGPLGLEFSGTLSGLATAVGSDNEITVTVFRTDGSVAGSVETAVFSALDNTRVAGDATASTVTFGALDLDFDVDGLGTANATVLGNNLGNTINARSAGGVFNLFGGDDYLTRTTTTDAVIDGGDGYDVVEYDEAYVDGIVRQTGGIIRVGFNTDTLTNVEELRFADAVVDTATLSVTPRNRDPLPDAESFEVDENGELRVAIATLLEGDTDPDGNPLTLAAVSRPFNGTVVIDDKGDANPSNDEVVFTPSPGFAGDAGFDYAVEDDQGGLGTATVRVTVIEGPNTPPAATPINAGAVTENAGIAVIDLLADAGATDPDGDPLDVADVGVTDGDGETVRFGLFGSALAINLAPFALDLAQGETATLTVAYTVTDDEGGETPNTATLVIEGLDGPFTWYVDADGDSFGVDDPLSNALAYDAPASTTAVAGDPDDADPAVFPSASDGGEDPVDDSVLQGTNGPDDIFNPLGAQRFTLGGGADVVRGAVENFFGDVIDGFGLDDTMLFEGSTIARSAIDVTLGSAILAVDTDGDGGSNGQLTLEGDFSAGDFMAVADSGDTLVTFETFLPVLRERQAINSSLVNGVINQNFLKGDGATDFRVTLRDLGFAGYANVLGVYEIDVAGNIVDTRILFKNANADKAASVLIEDVEGGHNLGFFIVQDAADWAATLAAGDTLSFVNSSGDAANVSDGADISIAVNGAAVDEMVFHSFDEDMNSDGVQHALSGVEVGGEAITIGFEDLTGGGDRDYEDVAFRVELVGDIPIA